MQGDPLGRDEILKLVKDRLGEILEVEPSSIQEGDSFRDDLDADSLALIELVEAIEEELPSGQLTLESMMKIWKI